MTWEMWSGGLPARGKASEVVESPAHETGDWPWQRLPRPWGRRASPARGPRHRVGCHRVGPLCRRPGRKAYSDPAELRQQVFDRLAVGDPFARPLLALGLLAGEL